MAHFLCRLLSTDTKDVFGVGHHNVTDTKDPLLGVRQGIKDGSLVLANLSQLTPFERYRL
jgi:hypothetical protein